ncbi:MAG: heme o synthase [Bowdeniella nasicola]|nr:heme o synthase [Bowdeniella nasicola]
MSEGLSARPTPVRQWSRSEIIRGYIELTKPRIIELLLITTVPTMILAQRGWPGAWLVLATLIGGATAAGAANVFNMVYDRDIDRVMRRTKKRPIPSGKVSVRGALIFGFALSVFSSLWFWLLVNSMAALLTLAAIVLYAVGYTIILKRHTAQNIVWGGVAGCMPVLIGWSAVTGGLDWPPLILFAVIFFWTPPHYWPLSMKFKQDYAAAQVPMLPVVASDVVVARNILIHTAAMIACTLALIPVAHMTWFYTVIAVAAAVYFAGATITLYQRALQPQRGRMAAMRVFHASITYLSIVFVAVALDPFVGPWLNRLLGV